MKLPTIKLVDDWRDWWRWYSSHCIGAALALQGAWLEVPDDLRASVPSWALQGITAALLVLGFVGRLVNQERKVKSPDEVRNDA